MSNVSELEKCPHCGSKFKGLFASGLPVKQEMVDFINSHFSDNKETYCTNCAERLGVKIVEEVSDIKKSLVSKINEIIDFMPIITSIAPDKWDYDVLNMVETQTTSGTGVLTDLSRGINDLLGTTSNTSNSKIEKATNRCKRALKMNALKLGGNAIMAVDIDYSEVGSGSSNMLMVCMAGTAINVKNLSALSGDLNDKMELLSQYSSELSAIQKKLDYLAN